MAASPLRAAAESASALSLEAGDCASPAGGAEQHEHRAHDDPGGWRAPLQRCRCSPRVDHQSLRSLPERDRVFGRT